jgi:hypothetical protein
MWRQRRLSPLPGHPLDAAIIRRVSPRRQGFRRAARVARFRAIPTPEKHPICATAVPGGARYAAHEASLSRIIGGSFPGRRDPNAARTPIATGNLELLQDSLSHKGVRLLE